MTKSVCIMACILGAATSTMVTCVVGTSKVKNVCSNMLPSSLAIEPVHKC